MREATFQPNRSHMTRCLAAIDALGGATDLSTSEVALRLDRYGVCAKGGFCPDVAFDPVAVALRLLWSALADHPAVREAWEFRIERSIARARLNRAV